MPDTATYLARYQQALAAQGADPLPLAREADSLDLLSGPELERALGSFAIAANRFFPPGTAITALFCWRRSPTGARSRRAG